MEDGTIDRLARSLAVRLDRRIAAGGVVAIIAGGLGAMDASAGRCKRVNERKVKRHIKKAARKYKQPYKKLLCVAMCESDLNNCAVNKAGKSYGLYQFINSTWKDPYLNPKYHKKNLWDPEWSAMATAEMWSRGLATHWDCCCPHFGCDCPGKNPPWCRR
jgi:hypothetical protein